ncbi:F-box domain containing protein, partial [Tanacetum coccineum]
CVLPSFLTASYVKFQSLKLLHLECVHIDEKVIMYLTAGSPLLEEFNVLHCYGFKIFYAHGLQNLQKLWIYFKREVERIDIEAPSLCDVNLVDWERRGAPSMNLALCEKLITLLYDGYPVLTPNSFADLSSICPYIKNLFLNLPRQCNNLKLFSHSLQTLVVHSYCDLDEIDISTPNLVFFEYKCTLDGCLCIVRDPLEPKPVFECSPIPENGADAIWFEKLRRFLDKNIKFKVMKLCIL